MDLFLIVQLTLYIGVVLIISFLIQIFTERPANDPQTERMRPDLVIEFLARYPSAVISYLEYLIFNRKLQVRSVDVSWL